MQKRHWNLTIALVIFAVLTVMVVQVMQQYVEKANQINARTRSDQAVELRGRIITLDEALTLAGLNKLEDLTGGNDVVPVNVNIYPDEHLSIPSGHLAFGQMIYILQFDRQNNAALVVSMLDNKIGWITNNYVILAD